MAGVTVARVAAPTDLLMPLAAVVLDDLRRRLRCELAQRFGAPPASSVARVGSYYEAGAALIARLQGEPELSVADLGACAALADRDRRFRFVHRIPKSAGFGAAIGTAIQATIFGAARPPITTVAALLNVFMTVLDGLLDETPEIIAPYRDELYATVCTGAAGGDIGSAVNARREHPFVALCFAIVGLWTRTLCEAAPAAAPEPAFVEAIREAMQAEYANADANYHAGLPTSDDALYGRTRWPHWAQALAGVVGIGWPAGIDPAGIRRFMFRVAEYGACLDDICDYLIDCAAMQWNTVSYTLARHDAGLSSADRQRQLLAALGEPSNSDRMIAGAMAIRTSLEEAIPSAGVAPATLRALVADLTFVYLGRD